MRRQTIYFNEKTSRSQWTKQVVDYSSHWGREFELFPTDFFRKQRSSRCGVLSLVNYLHFAGPIVGSHLDVPPSGYYRSSFRLAQLIKSTVKTKELPYQFPCEWQANSLPNIFNQISELILLALHPHYFLPLTLSVFQRVWNGEWSTARIWVF